MTNSDPNIFETKHFVPKLKLGMFLFSGYFSLDVLIKDVLKEKIKKALLLMSFSKVAITKQF